MLALGFVKEDSGWPWGWLKVSVQKTFGCCYLLCGVKKVVGGSSVTQHYIHVCRCVVTVASKRDQAHHWCSGNIVAFQAIALGSIPGWCIFAFWQTSIHRWTPSLFPCQPNTCFSSSCTHMSRTLRRTTKGGQRSSLLQTPNAIAWKKVPGPFTSHPVLTVIIQSILLHGNKPTNTPHTS
jgi:hypothetical protein